MYCHANFGLARRLTALALAGGLMTVASPVLAYNGQELAGQAQVGITAARAAALGARPGKVTDEELEKEAGGSGLRYSFDILSDGKAYEVGVHAMTGAVLENKAEGKNPD